VGVENRGRMGMGMGLIVIVIVIVRREGVVVDLLLERHSGLV